MTYSNSPSQNRSSNSSNTSRNTSQSKSQVVSAYFAGLSPAMRRVIKTIWMWMCRLEASYDTAQNSGRYQDTIKFKVALMALAILVANLKGTREEKTALMERLFAKLGARRRVRMVKLYAKYVIWRQRKCWMWDGGFMGSALAQIHDVYEGAAELISFDALIPD